MRIGIDAKWFFHGPPSGRRVVRGLVHGLSELAETGHELHWFLDARARPTTPTGIDRERCHYIWGGANQLANLFLLPRAADRLELDAVVYQNFAPPSLGTRHARIAFVYDVIFAERPEFFTWRERMYFAPLRSLSSRADRVCTVSESEKTRIARLGFANPDRIDVVPIAIDDVFVPREAIAPLHLEAVLNLFGVREPFVLYVGRLTARKNIASLVRAMAHVAAPGLQLVVAGAPDNTCRDLQAVARAAGVESRVQFVGPVGDDNLAALYAAAAVVCFPSLHEGFGLPPLEAMAAGTPTVVSDISVLRETCGDAAVYVDTSDPRAIAGAVDALIVDKLRREQLRAAGLRRASSFTWRRSAEALLDSVHAAVRSRP